MNTDAIHAGRVARAGESLLRRLMRRLRAPRSARAARIEAPENPAQSVATWPECVGHPYVIGPGTLLVMTYMRTRLPRFDRERLRSTHK